MGTNALVFTRLNETVYIISYFVESSKGQSIKKQRYFMGWIISAGVNNG